MNIKLFAMLLVSVFAVSMFAVLPTQAWVITPSIDDQKFELYGPHVKGILIKLYDDLEEEMTYMNYDHFDVEDWSLPYSWITAWEDDPRFTLVNYGGEAGFFILDLNKNNNPTLPGGGPNPAYPNPCSVKSFREALAWCVNRTFIIQTITLGRGLPMWTPVPIYMTTYVHPDIKPGQPLEALTHGGWSGNYDEAVALLEAGGFHIGLDGLRYWDMNENNVEDDGEHVRLRFYVRVDDPQRLQFSEQYALTLNVHPVDIDIDFRAEPRSICSDNVMGAKNFHLYTGGWNFIGPDPNYLYDLYHSSMYWHPGKPPNYGDCHDELLDMFAEQIKFANTAEEGTTATLNFQVRFADLAWSIPLWCAKGVKAFKNIPMNDPDGPRWIQFVNQQGFGVNSWWSFLNVMQDCDYYPDMYIDYGFMTPVIDWLNPVYAESYWDCEVIGKIYDSCSARIPYDLGKWVPQLAKNWTVGLWTDSVTLEQKSKVRITLRPDLCWQDGVPISTADLFYTWIESVDVLLAKGLPPPWWYPTVQYFRDFCILDPCNVEILLDVKAVWAAGWVLGSVVIPKHIWKPIVDISTPLDPVVHTPQPDPNVIGSGPYRFVEYIPRLQWIVGRVILDANTPGSIVHGITSPGYFNYYPVHANIHAKAPYEYRQKLDIPHSSGVAPPPHLEFEVKAVLNSMWLNDSFGGILEGTKYVYVDDGLIFSGPVILVTLPDGTIRVEADQFPLNLTKCKHTIKLAFHIESPSMLDELHPNPWLCQWINVTQTVWVTIKEDIWGDWWDTWHPWKEVPAPDCKVDIKDVSTAGEAFGSKPGDPNWNSVADINGDYTVNVKDIASIAKMFGKW